MVDPVKKDTPDDTELRGDAGAAKPPARDPLREAQQRRQLSGQLAKVDGWLARLHDPEQGGVGLAFQRAARGILRREDIDFEMKPSAGYHSFIYPPNPGQDSFSNYVLYGTEALENAERLMGARTHEYIHALQYQSAAALHADPFNDATNILVSPYDYLLRKERLEQDAYVKGAWLCSLAAADAPDIVPAMAGSPLPVSTFENIRAKSAGLQDAFETAARDCRNLLGVWAKDAKPSVIADEWHARALDEYALLLQYRHDNLKDGESLTLIRLEGRDILEIGASFGPNTFGSDAQKPALTEIENLSPANAQKLAEIEKKFGLPPRLSLPTLQETLATQGRTRADFIQASKNHKGAGAAPAKPGRAAANDIAAAPLHQNTGPRPAQP